MKLLTLLREADYGGMLSKYGIDPHALIPAAILSRAKRVLKKNDRIVWFLRWARLMLLHSQIPSREPKITNSKAYSSTYGFSPLLNLPDPAQRYKAFVKAYDDGAEELARQSKIDKQVVFYNVATYSTPMSLLDFLQHYMNLDVPVIRTTQFVNQTPDDIIRQFDQAEKDYYANKAGTVEVDPRDTVFLDLGDGFKWMDLNRTSCDKEAKAGGHCGNRGSTAPSETILSLRKGEDKTQDLRLTFILDKQTGMLGEMKGRANTKPAKDLHKYIIPLLLDPRIKGITGGGYMPETNFSILDLGEKDAQTLYQQKPFLASLLEAILLDGEFKTSTFARFKSTTLLKTYQNENVLSFYPNAMPASTILYQEVKKKSHLEKLYQLYKQEVGLTAPKISNYDEKGHLPQVIKALDMVFYSDPALHMASQPIFALPADPTTHTTLSITDNEIRLLDEIFYLVVPYSSLAAYIRRKQYPGLNLDTILGLYKHEYAFDLSDQDWTYLKQHVLKGIAPD